MEEKRSLERVRCYYYLKVYDKNSQEDIGSVIDITTKGMKLISENPFKSDSICHFAIKLPKGYIYGDFFDIDAKNRWCNKKEDENYYEAGFEFMRADSKGVFVVKTLISDFKNNDLL